MLLRDLVDHFSRATELTIELDEIVEHILRHGIQDEIHLFGADTDPTKLRGAFVQFTYHKAMCGDPVLVTHVVYSENVELE